MWSIIHFTTNSSVVFFNAIIDSPSSLSFKFSFVISFVPGPSPVYTIPCPFCLCKIAKISCFVIVSRKRAVSSLLPLFFTLIPILGAEVTQLLSDEQCLGGLICSLVTLHWNFVSANKRDPLHCPSDQFLNLLSVYLFSWSLWASMGCTELWARPSC